MIDFFFSNVVPWILLVASVVTMIAGNTDTALLLLILVFLIRILDQLP